MTMTKRIMAICLVAIMALMMFPMAVSAAAHLNTSEKVSFSVNCAKPGYTFTVYKVGSLTTTIASPYETKYESLTEISNEILNGDTAAALAALDGIETMPASATVVGTFTSSASTTSESFSNLEQGLYYIKATNFPAGVKSVSNSLVALPYYNETAKDWTYSIENIDLATKVVDADVTTEKTITNSTKDNKYFTDVALGDTVNFQIESTTAGSKTMKLKSYTLYDNMSKGLTLDPNSFVVKVGNTTLTKNTDYTVTIDPVVAGQNTTFTIALTEAYLQKDAFYDANTVTATYSATLNEYAVTGNMNSDADHKGNYNEEVKLEYSNKNGVTSEVEGNTVYVYTYKITANKYDEKGSPLAGSTFELYATEQDAKDMKNAIATATSAADGKVDFATTLQSGTYYVVETAAPTGYNVYGNVITIDATASYLQTFTDGTWINSCPVNGETSGEYHFDVHNTKLILPVTGGEGRMVTYVIGATVVVVGAFIACAYIVSKKRKALN